MSDMNHFWPMPWRFEEEGHLGGPCVKDANGQVILALFWPHHPADETERAERATYDIGRAIAAGAQRSVEDDEPTLTEPQQ